MFIDSCIYVGVLGLTSRAVFVSYVKNPSRTFARASPFDFVTKMSRGGGFGSSISKAKQESDPGAVTGTSLRVLKYPHPKVSLFCYEATRVID